MKKWYLCLLLFVIFSSCKRSLVDNMVFEIKHTCADPIVSVCVVDIQKVTNFKWDTMYLFNDWTFSDSISKAIGFSYDGSDVPDDYSRILFICNKKVVYEEDFIASDYNKSTINFYSVMDSLSKVKISYITSSKAIFNVRAGKYENSCKDCFVYSLTNAIAIDK